MVVAQSAVPPPTLAPVMSSKTSSFSTPNKIDPNESDYESIVVVQSSEVQEPKAEISSGTTPTVAETQPGSVAAAPPAASSEPRVSLEFAMPKTPPPSSKPTKMSKEGKRSQQWSRSSSSKRFDSRQRDEVRASITRGVNASDVPPNLKWARGRGRGKITESKAPLLIPTSPLNGITKPREGLRITIPAGSDARTVELITAFPANVGHLAS